jgi:tetratricopeptide (TPR) repeat protein
MKCLYILLISSGLFGAMSQQPGGLLDQLGRAEAFARRGDVAAARKLHSETCAMHVLEDPACLRVLGVIEYISGDYPQSHKALTQAAARYRALGEAALPALAQTLLQQGDAAIRLNSWKDAEEALGSSISLLRALYGGTSNRTADALGSLGGLWSAQGFSKRAEPLLLEAVEIYRRNQSTGDQQYASVLSHLALLYSGTGRVETALPLAREAAAIIDRTLGADHLTSALSLANLAHVYLQALQPVRALPLLRKASAAYAASVGADHPDRAQILMQEALIHLADRKVSVADDLARQAIATFEKAYGPRHLETLIARANHALIRLQDRRFEEAEKTTREVLELLEGDQPRVIRTRGASHYALGDIYALQRRFPEAERQYAKALELYERIGPGEAPELAALLEDYARVLRRDRARSATARGLQERAKSLRAR